MIATLRRFETLGLIIAAVLVALDGYLWYGIMADRPVATAHDYFLDVGQGDAEIVAFDGGVKIMTDAGPTNEVLTSIAKALGADRYIDIGIISHPQLDHFNGYNFLLDAGYRFGVFVYNGRDDDPPNAQWSALLAKIKEKHIPLVTLGADDRIEYGANSIDMLSPDKEFAESAELNDTGFVEYVTTPEFTTLLTADTGMNVENFLMKKGLNLRVDVLKVGHHGSQYASGSGFLRAVDPSIAVIEVGAHNTYGHPTKETLARLASSTTAKVFRTDKDGTIVVGGTGAKLSVRLLYND